MVLRYGTFTLLRQVLSTALPRSWGSAGDKPDCDVVDSGPLPRPTYMPESGELSWWSLLCGKIYGC